MRGTVRSKSISAPPTLSVGIGSKHGSDDLAYVRQCLMATVARACRAAPWCHPPEDVGNPSRFNRSNCIRFPAPKKPCQDIGLATISQRASGHCTTRIRLGLIPDNQVALAFPVRQCRRNDLWIICLVELPAHFQQSPRARSFIGDDAPARSTVSGL